MKAQNSTLGFISRSGIGISQGLRQANIAVVPVSSDQI
jgi:hypothetical protein